MSNPEVRTLIDQQYFHQFDSSIIKAKFMDQLNLCSRDIVNNRHHENGVDIGYWITFWCNDSNTWYILLKPSEVDFFNRYHCFKLWRGPKYLSEVDIGYCTIKYPWWYFWQFWNIGCSPPIGYLLSSFFYWFWDQDIRRVISILGNWLPE